MLYEKHIILTEKEIMKKIILWKIKKIMHYVLQML